jgi:Mg2+-importing ATPase
MARLRRSSRSVAHQTHAGTGALAELARLSPDEALERLHSLRAGLEDEEADRRFRTSGPNRVLHEAHHTFIGELAARTFNPLNLLLLVLAIASYVLGDPRAAIMIGVMVVLSTSLSFIQEHRSNQAADALRKMVRTTATVMRQTKEHGSTQIEIPIEQIVMGDVVLLSAGDMVPADLRLISARDLFVNQSALTGESMPLEKSAHPCLTAVDSEFELPNVCFMGTAIISGVGCGVVISTGKTTIFGRIADVVAEQRVQTSFDKGVTRFTWLMIRFILVMAPLVLVINGVTKGNWFDALLFAVAVAVGLTPEMLPMIVTVNLAKGAMDMSRKKVIVKRLNAIQNFGALDVLCTDKTGTLTQDKIILKRHLDIHGNESDRVLEYAYLNSAHQSGLKNLLDVAVLKHVELHEQLKAHENYTKIDEMPFDFEQANVCRPRAGRWRSYRDLEGRCRRDVLCLHSLCTRWRYGFTRRKPLRRCEGHHRRAQRRRLSCGGSRL